MFEAGRKYVITTLDAEVGGEVQKWAVYQVDKVDGAMLRTQIDGRVVVFNTLSPKFVRAELIANDGDPVDVRPAL